VRPGEATHQGGFAGPVVPEQCGDLAGRERKVDPAQNVERAERFLATRVHAGGNAHRSALLVAVYMTGIGIAVSGVIVPIALKLGGSGGWKLGCLVMGILSAIAVIPAVYAVRRVPEQVAAPAGDGRLGLGALAPTFV
jgi:hypothetical protein